MHGHYVTILVTTELLFTADYLGFSEMRYSLHPESHVPRFPFENQERVDTVVSDCLSRLSWRHRARPSATLHEIQARS